MARFARLQAPVTNVDDAGIDRDTFDQMMIALDKDGDGHVTKDEFKIPCATARPIPTKQARQLVAEQPVKGVVPGSSPTRVRASDAGG